MKVKTTRAKLGKYLGFNVFLPPEGHTVFKSTNEFIAALNKSVQDRASSFLALCSADYFSFHEDGLVVIDNADDETRRVGYLTKDAFVSFLGMLQIPVGLISRLTKTTATKIIQERLASYGIRQLTYRMVDNECFVFLGMMSKGRVDRDTSQTQFTTLSFLQNLHGKYFMAGAIDATTSVILLSEDKQHIVELICSDSLTIGPRAIPGVAISLKDKDGKESKWKAMFSNAPLPLDMVDADKTRKVCLKYLDEMPNKYEQLTKTFKNIQTIKVKNPEALRTLARQMLGIRLDGPIETYGHVALWEALDKYRKDKKASLLSVRVLPNFLGRVVAMANKDSGAK